MIDLDHFVTFLVTNLQRLSKRFAKTFAILCQTVSR